MPSLLRITRSLSAPYKNIKPIAKPILNHEAGIAECVKLLKNGKGAVRATYKSSNVIRIRGETRKMSVVELSWFDGEAGNSDMRINTINRLGAKHPLYFLSDRN